jgi:hypothetical protein
MAWANHAYAARVVITLTSMNLDGGSYRMPETGGD